jgi:hypothetical protein
MRVSPNSVQIVPIPPNELRSGPLLTERDYVLRTLDFANTTNIEALHALQTVLVAGIVIPDPVFFYSLHEEKPGKLMEVRTQLVSRLEAVAGKKRGAWLDLANTIYRAGERITIKPTYLLSATGVEVHYRHSPADLDAALGYVLMMLLDSKRPYGRDLCRCKIPECQNFFLAIKPKTGRPRRDYCCQAHLDASRTRTGVRRVQDYRRRQKAKAIAKLRPTRKVSKDDRKITNARRSLCSVLD